MRLFAGFAVVAFRWIRLEATDDRTGAGTELRVTGAFIGGIFASPSVRVCSGGAELAGLAVIAGVC